MKFIKGDKVRIIKGRDRGRDGIISQVFPVDNKIQIEGLNVYKKHMKARGRQPAGIVEVSRPIPVSNVAHLCPKTNRPTRVAFKTMGGKKVRVCVVSGEVVSPKGN